MPCWRRSSASVTIRRATVDDAEGLSRLAGETFLRTWEDLVPLADRQFYASTAFSEASIAADLTDPAVVYLLAEEQTGLAGYARVHFGATPPTPIVAPAPVLLDKLYFLPAWHGTGAAALLMEAVLALARAHGGQTLWLAHHPSNTRAERFYLRQGFTDTTICLPFHLCGRIYEDTVLVRPLTTAPAP